MPLVHIPSNLQKHTLGQNKICIPGSSLKSVIDNLDSLHPGIKAGLLFGDRIKPNISIVVDGEIKRSGLMSNVSNKSEIHFIPRISGGANESCIYAS